MDNNKGQTIFLSVIGIATLLVAIIGATFAWFSITIQGNDKASSIIVTTATLGSVVFTDGNEINMTNIKPEQSPQSTKTFTIVNTTSGATEKINYVIYLDVTANTLSDAADGYFVHSLSGKANNKGTVATAITEQVVPGVGKNVLGNGTLNGTETHTYTYSIQFKESGSDQNAAQGKTFAGKLVVENAQ